MNLFTSSTAGTPAPCGVPAVRASEGRADLGNPPNGGADLYEGHRWPQSTLMCGRWLAGYGGDTIATTTFKVGVEGIGDGGPIPPTPAVGAAITFSEATYDIGRFVPYGAVRSIFGCR